MTHLQEPSKGDTKIWNVYIYRCFATDVLISSTTVTKLVALFAYRNIQGFSMWSLSF